MAIDAEHAAGAGPSSVMASTSARNAAEMLNVLGLAGGTPR